MISILLALVLQEGWFTRQVDCDNAFSQAELKETVLVKPPKCFAPKSGKYLYLKLLESLYGLKQAPRTFFENWDQVYLNVDLSNQISIHACLCKKE